MLRMAKSVRKMIIDREHRIKEGVTMELFNLYETFTKQSNGYLDFVEQLVNTDFAILAGKVIQEELKGNKERFESLMETTNTLEVEESQLENLKDFRYLLMDMIFLSGDLEHFYQLGELGRFKMRALNAINKKRRAEFFKEESSHGGNCPMDFM